LDFCSTFFYFRLVEVENLGREGEAGLSRSQQRDEERHNLCGTQQPRQHCKIS